MTISYLVFHCRLLESQISIFEYCVRSTIKAYLLVLNKSERCGERQQQERDGCISVSLLVWNVVVVVTKPAERSETDRNGEKQEHESVFAPLPDRPSQAIHYSLNASQCQLYYCEAVPDWRPRVGGEKWLQNTAGCPERKQGKGLLMDGCVWPRRAERLWLVPSRWDRESTEPLPLCSEHASLVSMRGIKLSCPCRCLRHLCQNRRPPYSTDNTGSEENTETQFDSPDVSRRANNPPFCNIYML